MFDRVKELFPCENWIFTLYQIEEEKRDYDKIASFCKEKEIEVVTISAETFRADALHLLHENGLRVYYHTVNRILTMLDFKGYGADGFYSDYVPQSDLEEALQATQYQ